MKQLPTNTDPALGDAIAVLEKAIAEKGHGLPEPVFEFISRHTPLVCVDMLIQDNAGNSLLTWRDDSYFGAGWHLPGGVIRYGESRNDRIRAVALAELNAEVEFESAPMGTIQHFNKKRLARGHEIIFLVRCSLKTPPDRANEFHPGHGTPKPGQWMWHSKAPSDLLAIQRPYINILNGDEMPDLPNTRFVEFDATYEI